ncbi:MAG: hypothetical protein WA821_00455 [Anaerolineales bacterium]
MAKVTLHPMIQQAQGQIGDLVFRRVPGGGTSLMRKPDMSKVTWSEAQAAHRKRFKLAVAYARGAMSDPQPRSVYEREAARRGKRPFDLAVSDYFHEKELVSGGKG